MSSYKVVVRHDVELPVKLSVRTTIAGKHIRHEFFYVTCDGQAIVVDACDVDANTTELAELLGLEVDGE